jgi:ribosomal protein S18 acetylase RimI-like enzyme
VAVLIDIVEAEPVDHPTIIQTLAQAFQDDPAVRWILPDAEQRRRRLPVMFAAILPGDIASGIALRSHGDEAATLWRAPGNAHTGRLEMLRQAAPMLRAFGTALGRALATADAIDAHQPKDNDFWYLHYAGVRPVFQGKGWGGHAIRAGLARAENEGKPVYLETATPANVGLYQRFGFIVVDEWDVPKGGPHFWSMLKR